MPVGVVQARMALEGPDQQVDPQVGLAGGGGLDRPTPTRRGW